MRHDPDAFYSFASMGNRCYHCRRPTTPLMAHQEAYCLAGAQADCPAFLQDASEAFPAALRAQEARSWPRRAGLGFVLAIALGLAALGFGAWRYNPLIFGTRLVVPVTGRPALGAAIAATLTALPPLNSSPLPTSTPTSSPTPKPNLAGSIAPTGTPTKTPTVTPTRTSTKTPTNTPRGLRRVPRPIRRRGLRRIPRPAHPQALRRRLPTSTALPQRHPLEVPFEIEGHELLLHWVGGGETFEEVNSKYRTSAEVIRSLNYSAQASLLANTVLVVAPALQIVDTSLPRFRVRQVGELPVTIEELALQFKVDAELVKRYNGCNDACPLTAGDWVLIPVVQQ